MMTQVSSSGQYIMFLISHKRLKARPFLGDCKTVRSYPTRTDCLSIHTATGIHIQERGNKLATHTSTARKALQSLKLIPSLRIKNRMGATSFSEEVSDGELTNGDFESDLGEKRPYFLLN